VSKIYYCSGNEDLCDEIEELWIELNEIHYLESTYFKDAFCNRPFSKRKEELIKQAQKGKLNIVLAKEDNKEVIGYCVSSVIDGIGEIESICITSNYRNQGVGNELMEKSLEWIKSYDTKKVIVTVAVGHEEVFPFYEKYNFYPRLTELQMK